MKRLITFFLATLPAFGAYNHVRSITIDHTKIPNTDQTNFPVVFTGQYPFLATQANGGGVTNANGYDIIFTSDSGCTTKLNFERSVWTNSTGQSEFVVEVPTLSHTSDTTIYLCYGNSSVTLDQQSSPWDTNAIDTNHFGNGAALSLTDSTGNLTFTASGAPGAMRGKLWGGMILNNGVKIPADVLTSSASAALAVSGNKTFEAWVNPTSFQGSSANTGLVTYGKVGTSLYSLFLTGDGSGVNCIPIFGFAGSTTFPTVAGPAIPAGHWAHLVGVINNTSLTLYVNGVPYTSSTSDAPLPGDSSLSLIIGRDGCCTTTSAYFDGAVDEVRVSNVARSADWITTEYNNLNSPATFYKVGQIINSSNISNVRISPTATQAVITFTTTSNTPGSCGLAVSESPSFSSPVIDVDASKFGGSELASRAGNIISGHTVTFIAGHRYAAQYATTGDTSVAWSRALQQGTPHYVEINCGSDAYDTTFTTATISVGSTHEDGIPADPNVPGRAMWPTLESDIKCTGYSGDCKRRDTTVIDPQEGTLVQPLVLPEDNINDDHLATHTFWLAQDLAGGWTIPGGFTGGTGSATITGSTSKLAIIGMDDGEAFTQNNSGSYGVPDYWNPAGLQFNFQAAISNAACNGTNSSDDCKVQLCVTLDGVSCATNAKTYEQIVSNTTTTYTIGSGQSYDALQKPGKRIWTHTEIAPHYPAVSCSGTTVTIPYFSTNDLLGAGTWFNPGSWIVTDSGVYQVSSITTGLQFTTTVAPATCGYLHISNFGLLVWKKTTTGDTLTLASPTLRDLAYYDTIPQINSGYIGAPITVNLPNGDPAALIRPKQGIYSLDLMTGHTEPFMSVNVNNSLGSGLNNPMDNNGDIWFLGNDTSLSKATYTGDYQRPIQRTGNGAQYRVPLWSWNMDTWLNQCGGGITSQCYNLTQITQASAPLNVLLVAFDPNYSTTPFNAWQLNGVEGGILGFTAMWNNAPGQAYIGWHVIFDPNATSNVNGSYGAGCVGQNTNPAGANYLTPGCIVAARKTWTGTGSRWTLDKGVIPILRDGWIIDQSPASISGGTGGGGPFVTNEVGTFSTVTCPVAFSAYPCIQLNVDGNPFDLGDWNAGNGDRSRPWLGPIQVGDYSLLGQNLPANPLPGWPEPFALLEVAQVSGNTLTLACIHSSECPTNNTANQQLYMVTNYPGTYPPWCCNGFGFGGFEYWNWKNDPHGTGQIYTEYSAVQGHGFYVNGIGSQATVNTALQPRCTDPQGNCYNNRNYQAMTDAEMIAAMSDQAGNKQSGVVAFSTTFAGIKAFGGNAGSNTIQLHPDFERLTNKTGVPGLALDGRPWMGLDGAPYLSQLTQVGTSTYKIAASFSSTLHLRIWDLQGYAGSKILRNITAPGSSMTDGAGGYYTMCFVLIANECWSGSVFGEVYVNVPYFIGGLHTSTDSACYFAGGEADQYSDLYGGNDICVFDAGVQNAHTRFNTTGFDSQGWAQQSLGHGMLSGRADIFHSIHAATAILNSPYPNWYWWNAENWDTRFATMLMKAPAFTPDSNSTARPFFASVAVSINVPAGANGAGVEVAYDEYTGNCSPNRNETCIAVSATVDQTTPWYWETSESGSYTPLSCTHGTPCTINAPILWGHVAKLTPVYFSGSTIVGRGPTQVIPVQ